MLTQGEISMILPDLDALDRMHTEDIGQRPTANNLNVNNLGIENKPVESATHHRRELSIETNEDEDDDENEDKDEDDKQTNQEANEQTKTYDQIISTFMFFGTTFGLEFKFVATWYTCVNFYQFWCCISLVHVSLAYTQYQHYLNGDYLRIMEPGSIYSVTCVCCLQCCNFVIHRKKLMALILASRRICLVNYTSNRADILKNGYLTSYKIVKTYAIMFTLFALLYVYVPITSLIRDGTYVSILPLEFLYVDQSTLRGFLIANGLQAYFGLYGCINMTLFATIFIHLVRNYTIQITLLCEDFKTLDRLWDGNVSLRYKQAYLRNICKKCQDAIGYLNVIAETYAPGLFVYFIGCYFGLIICLFEVAKINWTSGYTIALGLGLNLFIYCISGTQIEIANDGLRAAIYDTNWYNYDISSQKMMQTLLHQCQQISEIMIGSVAPLNVLTAISIVKSVYSFCTILNEML